MDQRIGSGVSHRKLEGRTKMAHNDKASAHWNNNLRPHRRVPFISAVDSCGAFNSDSTAVCCLLYAGAGPASAHLQKIPSTSQCTFIPCAQFPISASLFSSLCVCECVVGPSENVCVVYTFRRRKSSLRRHQHYHWQGRRRSH